MHPRAHNIHTFTRVYASTRTHTHTNVERKGVQTVSITRTGEPDGLTPMASTRDSDCDGGSDRAGGQQPVGAASNHDESRQDGLRYC